MTRDEKIPFAKIVKYYGCSFPFPVTALKGNTGASPELSP
jgi:hypothetical protein